jgi:hypothetical protein
MRWKLAVNGLEWHKRLIRDRRRMDFVTQKAVMNVDEFSST